MQQGRSWRGGSASCPVKWEESGTETSRPAIRIRLGWGAACQGTLTGGQQEKCLHSCENVTEGQEDKRVLLLLDNQTALSYMNNLDGTVSTQATTMARDLWLWCLQRDILLTAQHLPGVGKMKADTELRVMRDRSN